MGRERKLVPATDLGIGNVFAARPAHVQRVAKLQESRAANQVSHCSASITIASGPLGSLFAFVAINRPVSAANERKDRKENRRQLPGDSLAPRQRPQLAAYAILCAFYAFLCRFYVLSMAFLCDFYVILEPVLSFNTYVFHGNSALARVP